MGNVCSSSTGGQTRSIFDGKKQKRKVIKVGYYEKANRQLSSPFFSGNISTLSVISVRIAIRRRALEIKLNRVNIQNEIKDSSLFMLMDNLCVCPVKE